MTFCLASTRTISMAPDFSHNVMVFTKNIDPIKVCPLRHGVFFSLIGIRMQTMQKVLANCYGFCSLYNTQQQLLACKNY